jgi:hypothetical protein
LPRNWRQGRGIENGPIIGDHQRTVQLGGGASCTLTLLAGAVAVSSAPQLRGGLLRGSGVHSPLAVREQGVRGRRSWYLGARRANPMRVVAVLPLASGIAPARERFAVVDMEVRRETDRFTKQPQPLPSDGSGALQPTSAQIRACVTLQANSAKAVVLPALRSVQVKRGAPSPGR